jgi:hypothetical protein
LKLLIQAWIHDAERRQSNNGGSIRRGLIRMLSSVTLSALRIVRSEPPEFDPGAGACCCLELVEGLTVLFEGTGNPAGSRRGRKPSKEAQLSAERL